MITIPPQILQIVQIVAFLLGAYLMAFTLGLILWTWRDIRSRSQSLVLQFLSVLIVAFFSLPGLLIYYILRPQETLAAAYERALTEEAFLQGLEDRNTCIQCHQPVQDDFRFCPYCHNTLRTVCRSCGRLQNLKWLVCPYCGTEREPVETPTPATDHPPTG